MQLHEQQGRSSISFQDPSACPYRISPQSLSYTRNQETIQLPVQGITEAQLMGELAVLQALPIYQLALPFSLAARQQLEYVHNLTRTTL
jgi:hypothetical protein